MAGLYRAAEQMFREQFALGWPCRKVFFIGFLESSLRDRPGHGALPVEAPSCEHVLALEIFFSQRFYLLIHERHTERQRHRQREEQVPCREPDVGLYPWTPGSHPGLKAALNH